MTKHSDTANLQLFKILEAFDTHKELSAVQLQKVTGYPMASIRRILSDFNKLGKLNKVSKHMVYSIKNEGDK